MTFEAVMILQSEHQSFSSADYSHITPLLGRPNAVLAQPLLRITPIS